MKHCAICRSDASSLKASPQHDQHKHKAYERACDECWEAWISLQVEEKNPSKIRCMFTECTSMLDTAQIGKLARKGTVYR
jgi:Fe-S cluster biosynthesis and repair protein YggX